MPRAIWVALLSVGALVILNAVAATLAHPDPAAVVAGEDLDPVTTAVVSVVRVVVDEAVRGRRAHGVPRLRHGGAGAHRAHDVLDRPRRRAARLALPARVDRRKAPVGAIVATAVSAASGCCSAWTRPRSAA